MRKALIKEQQPDYSVRRLCKMMAVHPIGYYAWLGDPDSARSIEDKRLLGYIKLSRLETDSVYGYRKVTDDLRDLGESYGKHRVYRLMRPRMDRELAINAFLMAVWRRQPQSTVLVHSDQGIQFSCYDW